MNVHAPQQFTRPSRGEKLTFVIAGLIAAVLGVFVVAQTLTPPGRTARDAERALERKQTVEAKRLAVRALKQSAMDVRAVRVLAVASRADGPNDRSEKLLTTAARLSRRDYPTDALMAEHAVRKGDFVAAMENFDAMLRLTPERETVIFPILARITEAPAAQEALTRRLVLNPRWRPSFLGVLAAQASPATTFNVLSLLQASASKPTEEEVGAYLLRLVNQRQYESALVTWLLFMPADRLRAYDGVYDGRFNGVPGYRPFMWAFTDAPGGQTFLADAYGRPGNPALQVLFDSYTPRLFANQTVVLAAGAHVFRGDVMVQSNETGGDLEWKLVCEESGFVAMRWRVQGGQSWTRFNAPVTIPAEGCRGQMLTLQGLAGDRRGSMEVWFDNIVIGPEAAA